MPEKIEMFLKLPIESIKVGTLVWWKAERYMSGWDCPGIITNVNLEEKTFRIKTFDTMSESEDISFYNDEPESELTVCEETNIATYLNNKKLILEKTILEKEFEIIQLKINSDALDRVLKQYIKL